MELKIDRELQEYLEAKKAKATTAEEHISTKNKLKALKQRQSRAFAGFEAKNEASKPVYDLEWFLIDLKATLLKGGLEGRNINKVIEYAKKYSKLKK